MKFRNSALRLTVGCFLLVTPFASTQGPTVITEIALVSAVAQGSPDAAKDSPKPYEVKEAYEVYAAVLPSAWPWGFERVTPLVINSQTVTYEMCLRPDWQSEYALKPAIADYVKVNKKSWLLQRQFEMDKTYELRPHPERDGWIEVSAVGFNADKTVAVVYVGHHCGALCGGGGFSVLQKTDGKWRPLKWKGTSCTWVS